MTQIGGGFFGLSGITAALENVENHIYWGARQWQRVRPDVIVSTSTDAGASPTSLLRPGLIMGKIASTGKLKPWSPLAVDGSQYIYGLLMVDQQMNNSVGTAVDHFFGYCMIGGTPKAKSLLFAKSGNAYGIAGIVEEYMIRNALTATGRFQLDDVPFGSGASRFNGYALASLQTDPAAITLTAASNGTLQVANHTSATTYTLPTPNIGLRYSFIGINDAGFAVTSAGSGDDIIGYHDIAADTLTYTTTGKVIGTVLTFECIPTTSTTPYTPKWMVSVQSAVTTAGVTTLPVMA